MDLMEEMEKCVLDEKRLRELGERVIEASKKALGDSLRRVILHGSYARGDFAWDSDVNFRVLVDVPQEEACSLDSHVSRFLGDVDLEFDVLVSVYVSNCELFDAYADTASSYMDIKKDGIVLYAA